MNAQHLLQLYLVLHITGFTMMAGTILADFSVNRRLGKYLPSDRTKAAAMLDSIAALPRLMALGALLLVLTGIGMIVVLKGVVVQMTWFRVKMILVVLVGLNGTLIIRKKENRLKELLVSDGLHVQITSVRRSMTFYHTIELLLFLFIFVLSVFQF